MFYALLILPHLLGLIGLGVYAYRSNPAEPTDEWDESPGDQPPRGPEPGSPGGGPPLVEAGAPRRRLRVGERLPELYPRPSRREPDRDREAGRERDPVQPVRACEG